MFLSRQILLVVLSIFLLLFPTSAVRSLPNKILQGGYGKEVEDESVMQFSEAPGYRNQHKCPVVDRKNLEVVCDSSLVHIAMTIDREYLRGSVAAIHSVLKHTSCPENVFFHFIASDSRLKNKDDFEGIVQSTFPALRFKVYLAELLEPCVERVIYLDSDVIVVDDIQKLWKVSLGGSKVIGAPEYCHANFTRYFSYEFWSGPEFSEVFAERRRPCYFNTGVMIMDLAKWRKGGYTKKIEKWMEIQKERRIYELGSLPPFLLVFGGEIEAIEHRWNQHGLGGDNVVNTCRSLHPGPVSLLHWSGKGKPWSRLDTKMPCPVDFLWAPYDLYKSHTHPLTEQGL